VLSVSTHLTDRDLVHREAGSAPWHYVPGPISAALLGKEDRDEKKRVTGQWPW
jgi:hypothetical protein